VPEAAPPSVIAKDTPMISVTMLKAHVDHGNRPPVLRLQPGDRLMAKVLDIGKDGRVRLDLGRFTATVLLDATVRTGMHLPLEVVENAGQLLLRLRTQKRRQAPRHPRQRLENFRGMDEGALHRQLAAALGRVRGMTLWSALPTARKGVPHLLRRLDPLQPLGMSVDQIAGRLRETVEDSGLFFENRLVRHLESIQPQSGHPLQTQNGRLRRPAPATIQRDTKAVILQILSDLDKTTRPLPPALARVANLADGLLFAIQRQQHRILAHQTNPEPLPGGQLVYGPGADATASPGQRSESPGAARRLPTAWRRVTGNALPDATNGRCRGIGSFKLPSSVTGRRQQLTHIGNQARAVAAGLQDSPSAAAREGLRLASYILAYTRDARGRHDGAPHVLKSWRRLERFAAALAGTAGRRRPVACPIRRLQRLTAGLSRMIRQEILRFDADLRLLMQCTREAPSADLAPAPGGSGPSRPGEGNPMFTVTIPMVAPHPNARLHVHCPPRHGGRGTAGHQVAIMLSLVPMGEVRATVYLSPDGLQVSLAVSTEAALQLVETHRDALVSALTGLSGSVRLDTLRTREQSGAGGTPVPVRHHGGSGKVDIDA
jgi:hypothetical protein